jgi:hypothetical protein
MIHWGLLRQNQTSTHENFTKLISHDKPIKMSGKGTSFSTIGVSSTLLPAVSKNKDGDMRVLEVGLNKSISEAK